MILQLYGKIAHLFLDAWAFLVIVLSLCQHGFKFAHHSDTGQFTLLTDYYIPAKNIYKIMVVREFITI